MEVPIAEIKPNIKKAFILNILIVGIVVILIIALLIYINSIVGLGIFLDLFREFEIIISPAILLAYSIFIILFFTVVSLVLNYVTLGKISYTLYPNKMVYSKSFFIMKISDKTIPYANIAKISYEKRPFLNTAKVIIELTGMREDKVKIDFMDDAAAVVRKLQELVREYKSKYYAQYSQEYRYQNIMDRL